MRFAAGAGTHKANQDDRQVQAAVESVLNFGEITVGVLFKIEAVIGSGKGSFEIAEKGVDGMELLDFDACSAPAGNGGVVRNAIKLVPLSAFHYTHLFFFF